MLAAWISPEFANWVVELVELYLTNQLTTADSAAAAAVVEEVVVDQQSLDVVEWETKRAVTKHLTKKKSNKIHEVTGGRAKTEYGQVNRALTKSVTGQGPKELKALHAWSDGPRDHMPPGMLGLLSYAETQVDVELDEAYKRAKRFLSEGEVVAVASQVTDLIYDMCKNTGGFDTPLLQICPAPATKKRKAITQPRVASKQQKLITCH